MKWLARVAIEVVFEAKDANEAGEIAEALHVPKSYGGHEIVGRSHAYMAVLAEPTEEQNTDSEPK